ncbi:DUF2752 domain-containing protein [uncultured Brachyspira sp.]|uniref:DUF2752 domain-containing protein n=1 Tax=uncultured Brachyspira sp. TaxID=221953 RepID=UPI0025942304|nr:DUF2752 domain-containing protein [uncultured Brachyspira sp.]
MDRFLKFCILLVLIFCVNFNKNLPVENLCLFRATTGFPCPSCGMTRAYIHALNLDFKNALKYHPLFPLPAFLFVIIAFRKKIKIFDSIYNNNFLIICLIIIFIGVYIFRFINDFPYREPFTFNYDSHFYTILEILNLVKK